ncbi:DUF6465 family protein [Anaerotalea alkaliphila]|uniref:Uncharacterized protein n=1 Tax=Anaerotalea alkaliphila TaxID=2662126 RepID=A0A7X5HTW7_9FIRM|nr:DUF6465 family protein [Anaerotalea alkaliphila]NDL66585.1 hypothetical protein [Anaerotalea alkaliphila]
MKENMYLQFHGREIDLNDFSKEAKQQWKDEGKKVKDIKTLDLYCKPEEGKCYFVINDEFSGAIELA